MTAVPRCIAPRAAVADIRRERSIEASDASRGLRVDIQDSTRTSFSRPASGICLAPKQGFGDGFVAAQCPRVQARVVGGDLASSEDPFSPEQDKLLCKLVAKIVA